LTFKKGGFYSELAVTPLVIQYEYGMMSPAYDYCDFLPLFILHMCSIDFKAVIYEFPPFVPNDYLFNHYAKSRKDFEGKERWDVFGSSVREIMAKTKNLMLIYTSNQEKNRYKMLIGFIKDLPKKAD